MKIVFTGGGTGGHIYPLIAIIREIKKIYPKEQKLSLFYVGPKTSYGLDDLKKVTELISTIFRPLSHFFWLGVSVAFLASCSILGNAPGSATDSQTTFETDQFPANLAKDQVNPPPPVFG